MLRKGEQRFVGVLYEVPSNYAYIMNVALDVPAAVSDAFGMRGHVPVVGTADGTELAATLAPVGGGRHRLFLNNAIRRAIGKDAGDSVEVRIRLDPSDRTPETPPELREALAEEGATAAWEALTRIWRVFRVLGGQRGRAGGVFPLRRRFGRPGGCLGGVR